MKNNSATKLEPFLIDENSHPAEVVKFFKNKEEKKPLKPSYEIYKIDKLLQKMMTKTDRKSSSIHMTDRAS